MGWYQTWSFQKFWLLWNWNHSSKEWHLQILPKKGVGQVGMVRGGNVPNGTKIQRDHDQPIE